MLAELHEAGVPTVTPQPSTARFYRAAGFEFAGAWNVYEVDREHVPALGRAYRVRRLPADDLGPDHEAVRAVGPDQARRVRPRGVVVASAGPRAGAKDPRCRAWQPPAQPSRTRR
jgi:hypothetical protein